MLPIKEKSVREILNVLKEYGVIKKDKWDFTK